MAAEKQASDVKTCHSEVPESLAAVESASPDMDIKVDDIEEPGVALLEGMTNNNDNKNPPPIRDVRYWWISLICLLMGIGGPLLYYVESFNIAEGRYFQALTCSICIVICSKLFTFCKFDLEVNSIIGITVLWGWLFYGVIEWGRVQLNGRVAIMVGCLHLLILIIVKQERLQCILSITGVDFWVWMSVIICLILPVNLSTRMPAREGVVISHLYLIVWFLEMLYQGLVDRDIKASDVFLKSLPVLRLPIYMAAVYVLMFLGWRVFKCSGVNKQYELPRRIKTTPMSLYEGTGKMFPNDKKYDQIVEKSAELSDDKKGLVNRKQQLKPIEEEVVKEDFIPPVKVTTALPKPMILGQTVLGDVDKKGIAGRNPFSIRYSTPYTEMSGYQSFQPVQPLSTAPIIEQKLAGFDLSILTMR